MAEKSPKWSFRSDSERLSTGVAEGAIPGDLGVQADNGSVWYFDGSGWQSIEPPLQWSVTHFTLNQSDPVQSFLNLRNDPALAFAINAPETLMVSPGNQVQLILEYRYTSPFQSNPLDVTCRVFRDRITSPVDTQVLNVNSDSTFTFNMSAANVSSKEIFAISFQPSVITDPVIVTMSIKYNTLNF